MTQTIVEFENPIEELEKRIKELKVMSEQRNLDLTNEIESLRREKDNLIRKLFSNLSAWQKVQIARHPTRPKLRYYMEHVFDEFIELSGDRVFRDDPSILCGFCKIENSKMMVVGTNKGNDIDERVKCNFGCPHPEAYRKAMHKFYLAERFSLPIVTFIDTPGAFPGIEAEQRNQSQAIAENIALMSRLKVPIISILTGEGGSGGALAIGVCDKLYILEYAYYSVISPEGCAAILWKDAAKAPQAAEALNITSHKLKEMNIADEIIQEPLGGAHRNPVEIAASIREWIKMGLFELSRYSVEELVENRYQRFRNMGEYEIESGTPKPITDSDKSEEEEVLEEADVQQQTVE